jgi:hypothetical protein
MQERRTCQRLNVDVLQLPVIADSGSQCRHRQPVPWSLVGDEVPCPKDRELPELQVTPLAAPR